MMKLFCLGVFCLLLGGCSLPIDYHSLARAGKNALSAATVSDKDVAEASLQMRQLMDSSTRMAPENSAYEKRLKKLMAAQTSVNGVPLNYKVYMSDQLNANASPDGSIRVNSGLMDAMNDDELRFVVGHEIGHIAHGHSLNAMRMTYAAAAGRAAAGSVHPYASLAANSVVGELAQDFVNAQYSQSQELEADSYGMDFLKSQHSNPDAAVSAMRKLGSSGGGFLDSHPSNERRLQDLEALKRGKKPGTLKTDS